VSREKNIGIAPQGYHQRYYSDRDWRTYIDLLAKVVRFSQPGPILDLGAGCGYLVEAAKQWGLECVGLEGSPDAIEMAKQRVPDLAMILHRLSDQLPFGACSFQTVVLNQVIEHLECDVFDFTMKEVLRVLRPNGMVLVLSPARANKKEWQADPTHINLISPMELRRSFIKCGFVNIVSFDTPLYLLGNSRIGRGVMFVVFKLFRLDALSATANALAYKSDRR
jgi:SAM-dependent methyltransferase